ncbi:GIY-YIG nuclease family protein [Roseovarius nanhaiticus]|uniref:GIY-YIG nuclease family protein n=1 Tax=Roseovarius nanhaiticus TaxID=573024 RepID=UPI00248FCDF1|nr:GIY-YIG nuclease family protein [Roseovarius nanhaiticus]
MPHQKPLYIPRRSRNLPAHVWRPLNRGIPEKWHAIARAKGYRIHRRIRDRLHLSLECLTCGALTAHKIYTLRTAQPACGGCREAVMHQNAAKAGVVLGERDAEHRHYALYTLPCGHEARLQRGRIARLAKEGPAEGRDGFYCPICHTKRLDRLASTWGWTLIGADTEGDLNYRLLWHDACGHSQRVATANLVTGRYDCGGCGESWASAPSTLYMMRFAVPGLGTFVKLGYSRYPGRRMHHQLGLRDDVVAELIDELPMPSGQVALRIEKGLHAQLRAEHAEKVIPRADLAPWINVTSEVYAPTAEPIIRRMIDALESPCWPRKTRLIS